MALHPIKSSVAWRSRRIVPDAPDPLFPLQNGDRDTMRSGNQTDPPPSAACGTVEGDKQQAKQVTPLVETSSIVGKDKLRIVVFIDDLDRCKPDKVVEVLEAINIVLNGSNFFVVVGMDKKFIQDAIMTSYKDNSDTRTTHAWAEVFLQKIVQVSITLVRSHGTQVWNFLSSNIHKQAEGRPDPPAQLIMQRSNLLTSASDAPAASDAPTVRWAPLLGTLASPASKPTADGHASHADNPVPASRGISLAASRADNNHSTHSTLDVASPDARHAAGRNASRSDDPVIGRPVASRPARHAVGSSVNPDVANALASLDVVKSVASAMVRDLRFKYTTGQAVEELERIVAHYDDIDPAKGHDQYSPFEKDDFKTYHQLRLFDDVGPREVKRLLNHYRLLKYILASTRDMDEGIVFDRRSLLAWTILWWRWPRVMTRFMKDVHEYETLDGNVKNVKDWIMRKTLEKTQPKANTEQQQWRQQGLHLQTVLEVSTSNGIATAFDLITCGVARMFSMYRVGMELVSEDDEVVAEDDGAAMQATECQVEDSAARAPSNIVRARPTLLM